MNTPALSVGKDTVCYCTRCKMDLGHMIMSMVGSVPARVMCRTCKSEHNFKPKRGVKEPGGIAPSRGSPGSTTRTESPEACGCSPGGCGCAGACASAAACAAEVAAIHATMSILRPRMGAS